MLRLKCCTQCFIPERVDMHTYLSLDTTLPFRLKACTNNIRINEQSAKKVHEYGVKNVITVTVALLI